MIRAGSKSGMNYLGFICHTLYDPPRTSARLPLYRQDTGGYTIVKRPWGSQRDTRFYNTVCPSFFLC